MRRLAGYWCVLLHSAVSDRQVTTGHSIIRLTSPRWSLLLLPVVPNMPWSVWAPIPTDPSTSGHLLQEVTLTTGQFKCWSVCSPTQTVEDLWPCGNLKVTGQVNKVIKGILPGLVHLLSIYNCWVPWLVSVFSCFKKARLKLTRDKLGHLTEKWTMIKVLILSLRHWGTHLATTGLSPFHKTLPFFLHNHYNIVCFTLECIHK